MFKDVQLQQQQKKISFNSGTYSSINIYEHGQINLLKIKML